jgi:hypothetical protein
LVNGLPYSSPYSLTKNEQIRIVKKTAGKIFAPRWNAFREKNEHAASRAFLFLTDLYISVLPITKKE